MRIWEVDNFKYLNDVHIGAESRFVHGHIKLRLKIEETRECLGADRFSSQENFSQFLSPAFYDFFIQTVLVEASHSFE